MSDDISMRFQLQRVAYYRELCRGVRRSGRHNVLLALLMLFIAYSTFAVQRGAMEQLFALVYIALALGELAVGLYKLFFPSAEGILLDGIVLMVFAGFVIARQGIVMKLGGQPMTLMVFLGLYMLWGSVGRFKAYRSLRQIFAEQRPTADQIAWFDDLAREIRQADPETDDQAIDLPTKPHWKAKLLGTTAFFVAVKTDAVLIAGPEDFGVEPAGKNRRDGSLRVALYIYGVDYPEFEIDAASWDNYRKWTAAHKPQPN